MTPSPVKDLIEEDEAYAQQEFTFTFTRKEIATIVASVSTCRAQLGDPFSRSLCREVLAKIGGHEEYQASKRPRKGELA